MFYASKRSIVNSLFNYGVNNFELASPAYMIGMPPECASLTLPFVSLRSYGRFINICPDAHHT